jgi:ATP-dependent helicase HrpA
VRAGARHRRALPAGRRAAHAPLLDALETELLNTKRVDVRAEDWQLDRVPDHLRMTFRVEDARGRTLAEGKDLEALKASLRPKVQQALSAASSLERTGLTSWDVGTLPREVASGAVKGFPALVDEGTSVSLKVLGRRPEQAAAHWRGVRRLLLLSLPSPVKALQGRLTNATKLALTRNPHGSVAAVLDDCAVAAADALMTASGGEVRDAGGLRAAARGRPPRLVPALEEVLARSRGCSRAGTTCARDSTPSSGRRSRPPWPDMRRAARPARRPGFVTTTGSPASPDVARSLQASTCGCASCRRTPLATACTPRRSRGCRRRSTTSPAACRRPPRRPGAVDGEELRISLFAQPMRTRGPVSDKRIFKALDALLP